MISVTKYLWPGILTERESLWDRLRSERMVLRSALITFIGIIVVALNARSADAQDGILAAFGTLEKGERSATAAPLVFLYREQVDGINRTVEGSDDVMALTMHLAFGLGDRTEARLKGELAEDVFYLGGEIRKSLLSSRSVMVTLAGGSHAELFHTDFSPEWFNFFGLDATVIVSSHPSTSLVLWGALDLALEFADVDLQRDGSAVHLERFERVNLVPGFDYALSDKLHLVGEIAVPLNDRTFGYVAVGFTRYWR
jgi:hypothetical protein